MGRVRAFLVQPNLIGRPDYREPKDALIEASSLVTALEVELVASATINLQKLNSGTYFGKGKLEELKTAFADKHIDIVVLNSTLSPVQQRNLERYWHVKVLDRTALILEIFGKRARTREGTLQVNLAHLTYQRSRLVRSWTHLERQRGGSGFMGGPGETQIESDRRDIDNAIIRLKRQLEKVKKTRTLHRESRKKVPFPIVALVGYTNAGKSTIFNQLTGASVLQKDMVFATLDPTMRAVKLPSGMDVILSDTVGFISDLPTQLVAAFRATLEEVLDADLLLHVRDISHLETEFQASNVQKVLADLGVSEGGTPTLEVWNKCDLLERPAAETIKNMSGRLDDTVLASAQTGQGLDDLTLVIERSLRSASITETRELKNSEGRLRAWLYEHNLVVSEQQHEDYVQLELCWTDIERDRFDALKNGNSNPSV